MNSLDVTSFVTVFHLHNLLCKSLSLSLSLSVSLQAQVCASSSALARASLAVRKQVRDLLTRGQVDEAVGLLDDQYPTWAQHQPGARVLLHCMLFFAIASPE
jgi:hypothetical protein